jgi:hypothetical protein
MESTRRTELETDITLAARHGARILITGPLDRASTIVHAIAARDHRGATQEIVSCDAGNADHVIAIVADWARNVGQGRPPILWIKDVHRFGAAQQAALLKMISDVAKRSPVPVITSSNVDLFDRVTSGSFNADLFYCLNSIHIITSAANKVPGRPPDS